jgi:hypothetical protein
VLDGARDPGNTHKRNDPEAMAPGRLAGRTVGSPTSCLFFTVRVVCAGATNLTVLRRLYELQRGQVQRQRTNACFEEYGDGWFGAVLQRLHHSLTENTVTHRNPG